MAVVTGASSGIGAAISILLARHGFQVVLIARRRTRLLAMARRITAEGGCAHAIPADLSCESQRLSAVREVYARFPSVDVLVSSAGMGWYGYADRMSWGTARRMLHLNIESSVHLTLLFLRQMRRIDHGHIVVIGSVAGAIPSQGVALYSSTKSFLDAFCTALARESSGTGVHVTVVRPGPVRTEFAEAALRQPSGWHVPTERMGVSAERVADAVWGALRHPRRFVYVPWGLRVVPWIELTLGWLMDRIGPLLLRRLDRLRL